MLFSDFWVTDVVFVLQRAAEPNQGNRSLCYPDRYTLVYCLSGTGSFRTDGKTIHMRPNDVCLLPAGNMRAYCADAEDPWQYISSSFRLTFAADPPKSTQAIYFPQTTAAGALFLELVAAWQQKGDLYKLRSRTLLQQILLLLFTSQLASADTAPASIVAARQYIQAHFTQAIDLDALAANAGFSLSHFRKLFTAHTGRSPKQYILYLRLSKAKDLLSSDSIRVGEAAALCGFQNEFYFSNLFKQTYGCSPTAYQKRKPGEPNG